MAFFEKIIRALFVIVVVCLTVSLHRELDRQMQTTGDVNEIQLLPAASIAQLFSLGYDRLLADFYWLGFVQYMGAPPNPLNRFQQAYQYVDLITTLDPRFSSAYWFGAWSIGYWQKRPDLADKILQRGIAALPGDWDMPFMGGVNQYLFAHDAKRAAHYYRQASLLPGAPEYLARQAIILASPIPEYEKRIRSLSTLYYSAKEANLKQSAYNELVGMLYKMYKEAPVETIRRGARERLIKLGIDQAEL